MPIFSIETIINAFINNKIMPENMNQSDEQQEVTFTEKERKITWRSFIQISGFTIIFFIIAIVLMVIGLILFYKTSTALRENAGFWLIFSGVIVFLFTVIFGFEKIE
jgi:cytochrome c biogenesis protein CcdA